MCCISPGFLKSDSIRDIACESLALPRALFFSFFLSLSCYSASAPNQWNKQHPFSRHPQWPSYKPPHALLCKQTKSSTKYSHNLMDPIQYCMHTFALYCWLRPHYNFHSPSRSPSMPEPDFSFCPECSVYFPLTSSCPVTCT